MKNKTIRIKKTVVSIAMMLFLTSLYAQKPYRGAEVYSNEEILYGKFEMCMKMIKGSGMLSTFFLYKGSSYLPDVYWEEIDIEILGKDNATVFSTNIIIDGLSGNTISYVEEISLDYSLADDFHTYTLEWTPDYVAWYMDGVELRRETGSVVNNLTSPQSYRFNTWISCSIPWVGELDRSNLPQYQYVDWIEYYSYDDGNFNLEWRDDFNSFDTSRWSKATWTFDCNEVDFTTDNVCTEDGYLVLALTDPDPSSFSIKVINNSSSKELQVELPENGHYKIQLFDIQGKSIFVNEIYGNSSNIPYAGIQSGIYLLNVQSKDNSVTKKVYIE